jgi:hypothetical protein
MKTDIASAARAYRMRLEEIAKAPSLATAVKLARQALQIEHEEPRRGHVSVVGGFGHGSQEAYVAIEVTQKVQQVPLEAARKIAFDILEQATYAEQDGALATYLVQAGWDQRRIGDLIAHLRAFRARYREDLKGMGLADNEEPPQSPSAA